MHLHKCDHVNFFLLGGGGVVRLTAKPRYLLLHHRGKEKSNTVTALHLTYSKKRLYAVDLATVLCHSAHKLSILTD